MALTLPSPDQTVQAIVQFLTATFQQQSKTKAVIAASGGIDSSLSLALLCQAIPKENITVLMLPYKDQSTVDAEALCDFLSIDRSQRETINISPIVDAAAAAVMLDDTEKHRKGNLMARARMMVVFDIAKEKDALVCGTENKSEHFLGYYTRFGDAASDIEPIAHLYKTHVRALAEYLSFPAQFLTKAPSAGLWSEQTDEQELGFTYEVADQVLEQLADEHKSPTEIHVKGVEDAVVQKVIHQVASNRFKFHVPYVMK